MFKRKYVKISSEKVIQKIENLLQKEGWCENLEPIELYAFRYALGSMKININNPSIVKRIGLNDIPSIFKSSKFIISYGNNMYGMKNDDNILDICSTLDKRIIFLTFSYDGKYIEQIYVYLSDQKDTTLFLNNFYFYNFNKNVCVGNSEADFIRDLSYHNKDLIKYYLQDEAIIQYDALKFEKEFFAFTNLKAEGSTFTFHYVP